MRTGTRKHGDLSGPCGTYAHAKAGRRLQNAIEAWRTSMSVISANAHLPHVRQRRSIPASVLQLPQVVLPQQAKHRRRRWLQSLTKSLAPFCTLRMMATKGPYCTPPHQPKPLGLGLARTGVINSRENINIYGDLSNPRSPALLCSFACRSFFESDSRLTFIIQYSSTQYSVTYRIHMPPSGPVVDQSQAADANGTADALKRFPATYYTSFLSTVAKERKPSPIRSLLPLEATPGLISLLAGKPNGSTFPFTSFSFTARSPADPSQETAISIDGDDLAEGLQYGPTDGYKGLLGWFYGLQERMHGRKKGEGWKISVGSGSQDLICKAVTALVNPGDAILVESPVYAGVIPIFQSLHCEQIEVDTDADGISSASLRAILEGWPLDKPKPKVLYTVPYGCNPTGMTATLERRLKVLRLAREHDFIILEDDPYYYVYYGKAPRSPSYFALELQEPQVGRVLRFDSVSKILSGGMRIGFASGPEPILTAIDRHTSTANLQTSGLTQVITFKLLENWGYDGFLAHTKRVSEFYREKRDVFERAMKKYLDGLAEWNTPEAGMFFWFKLCLKADDGKGEEEDSEALIRTKAFEKGVLALPGTVFMPNGRKTGYVRASFSIVGEDEVEEGLKRLRETILESRG
ncbi:hypothetical protein APHAL10511_008081 [Amanita phalloides]|nr:hypothetical protein APHAL10511_008081 [Amanita phalloides]